MKKLLLANIFQLATPMGNKAKKGKDMQNIQKIQDAYVLILEDVIVGVGEQKHFDMRDFDGEVIDCSGCAVVPGFVDSHTHLVFGGHRAEEFNWRLNGQSYQFIMQNGGGIVSSTTSTKQSTREQLTDAAMQRLNLALSFGVTTMEAKSGYGLDLETELKQLEVAHSIKHPISLVHTFMGAHATPKSSNPKDYLKFVVEQVMPVVAQRGLAEYCDIFTEKGVFEIEESREYLKKAQQMGFKTKMHADEIVNIGGSQLAAELNCTSADHLLKISDEGIEALKNSNTIATLLPLTAFCLNEEYAPARKLIDSGCAVALATDLNPGSCFCQNIPLMIALSAIIMKMNVEEILTALTLNGACAIDRGEEIGTIEVGKKADINILQWQSIDYLPYHTATNSVKHVIKNGKVVQTNNV